MAMSNYNRVNPFMYLLEQKTLELQEKCQLAIKYSIYNGILMIISLIGFTFTSIFYTKSFSLFTLIVILFPVLVLFGQIAVSVKNVEIKQLNLMIYGDNFEGVNLNNEELVEKIGKYNTHIGRVEYIMELSYIYDIFYLIYIAKAIIETLLFIF